MKKLITLDDEWGGLIRTILIIIALGLLSMADQRYITKREAEREALRLNTQLEKIEMKVGDNYANYVQVMDKLGRIQAQNEIILDIVSAKQD